MLSKGEFCGVENFGGNILRNSMGPRKSGVSFALNENERFSERAREFLIKAVMAQLEKVIGKNDVKGAKFLKMVDDSGCNAVFNG